MWIRSQDRKILTEIHNLDIDDIGQIWDGSSLLGKYSTEEKALKVLNGIQKAISDRVIVDGKLYSPPRRSNESHATTTKRDAIYIMPQDEDVKA